jgi:hypothetical protein
MKRKQREKKRRKKKRSCGQWRVGMVAYSISDIWDLVRLILGINLLRLPLNISVL